MYILSHLHMSWTSTRREDVARDTIQDHRLPKVRQASGPTRPQLPVPKARSLKMRTPMIQRRKKKNKRKEKEKEDYRGKETKDK
jgi:hypothetical protein